MSTNTTNPSQRVAYNNGILLDASDFQQEQLYHRSRLAAALTVLHGSGTIAGLKAELIPAKDATATEPAVPEQLIVNPGIALDRIGRLVEIKTKQSLRLDRWYNFQKAKPGAILKPFRDLGPNRYFIADILLRYRAFSQGLRPGFPEPAADATDAIVPSRANDSFELLLVPRDCDPEIELPAIPKSRFDAKPTTKAELLDAIYKAYDQSNPAIDQDSGQGASDVTAIFITRVRIRLVDAPSTSLNRHASAEVVIDDLDRPLVTTTELLRQLLPV
ncbi:MAG: hypothetical protein QM715_19785 [Nibricoccus sp.]